MINYDGYVYGIVLLLPLSAAMLVFQTNPYNTLVMRGILGAVSALVYTVLGAADVALTEALVGAFLATMLYAVAVRSSLVLRLGVMAEMANLPGDSGEKPKLTGELGKLSERLRSAVSKYHMRVELVPYQTEAELVQALVDQTVHGIVQGSVQLESYQLKIRPLRLYEIIQAADLASAQVQLVHVQV